VRISRLAKAAAAVRRVVLIGRPFVNAFIP
jgi:hypothetical protein